MRPFGTVCVLESPAGEAAMRDGEVLVTRLTSPRLHSDHAPRRGERHRLGWNDSHAAIALGTGVFRRNTLATLAILAAVTIVAW